MKKTLSLLIFLLSVVTTGFAQVPTCSADVPVDTCDLRGQPTGSWISPARVRHGNCCNTHSPDRCISFVIYVDTGAAMISFEIASGAIPTGSMFYQVNCGPQTPVGDPICISGAGPHYLTFCKPGSNLNTYRVRSIAKPHFPPPDTVRIGCSHPIPILGLAENSVTWNSIFPGAPGAYNSYINCTNGCDTAIYTPAVTAPPMVEYLVCGTPLATLCGYVAICDTVRIYNFMPLTASVTPNPGRFCQGGPGVTLNATASGGVGPYSFTWRDSGLNQTCTGSSCLATGGGTYSLEARDMLYDSVYCPAEFVSVPVIVTSQPVVNAGADQTLCPNNPQVVLSGSVQFADSAVWSGGGGIFTPDRYSLLAGYTPTPAEIAAGQVTFTLTSVGAGGGCVNSTDQVTIHFPPALVVNVADVSAGCNGGTATLTSVVSGGTAPYAYQWNTGPASSTLTAGQGTYCLSVTDNLGCTVSDCGTITVPSALNISMSSTPCTSNGGSDGTATALVTGGTAPYTYLWSTNGTTATLTNLSYGVYTVVVTDAHGCSISSSVVVNEPRCNNFLVSVSGNNISCNGNTNGSATVTVTNGTPNYTYLWNDAAHQTTPAAFNLAAGVYQCIVTDAAGCFAAANISLTQPTALTNTMTHVNASTIGGNDGSASANVTGGSPAYTYTWSNGGNTAAINLLTAGTYSLVVHDANNCSLTDSVRINQPPCANLAAGVASTNVSCFGASDGGASVIVLFGSNPITYLWSTGATTSSISGLAAGTYNVTVTDGHQCSTFVSFTISQPSPLSISLAATSIRCNNTNDGTIELTVSGGTFPYTYDWSNGTSVEDQINLTNGIYNVSVTDANGCAVSGNATITRPAAIAITSSITPVTCRGGSNGAVDVSVAGGVAPYTYNWSNGATTQDIAGLASDEYLLTVTDANNCTNATALSALVDQPDTVKVASVVAACPVPGSGVSAITLTPVGGNAGTYQFSLDGGSNWLASGIYNTLVPVDSTYTIVVRDTFGCVSPAAHTLPVAPAVDITSVLYNPCIPDGETFIPVNLVVNGGSSSLLSASYDNGATWMAPGNYSQLLTTGTSYTIIARDSLGCVSLPESISLSTDLVLNGTTSSFAGGYQISCAGSSTGTIDLTAAGGTGGYSYAWSNAATSQDLNSLTAGSYSVVVTDNSGCADTIAFSLAEPAALTGSVVASNYNGYNISCNGATNGTADQTISGGVPGYTYSWSNSASTEDISGVGAGTYSVTVTDQNGCTLSQSVSLTQPAVLGMTAAVQQVLCNSFATGSIDLATNGGVAPYNFSWTNSATTEDISSLAAGNYQVTITDLNGCSVDSLFAITEPAALSVVSTVSNFNGYNISCNGSASGTIDLATSGGVGGYTYNWSNASTTEDQQALTSGTYSVIVSDNNACTATLSFSLTQPAALTGSVVASNYNGYNISCNGATNGAADQSVAGGVPGYTYSWSNSASTEDISGVGAGTYSVTVTDQNGCTLSQSVSLTQPAVLGMTAAVQQVLCNSFATGSIDLATTGGVTPYNFSWTSGATTEDISSLAAGNYQVTITDLNGCSVDSLFTITEPAAISVTAALSDFHSYNISCNGSTDGTIDMSVTGGVPFYSYNWSNSSANQDLTDLAAGTYSVLITDANGCTNTQSFTLSEPAAISGSAVSVNSYNGFDVSCAGSTNGAIDLTVNGGVQNYAYSWTNGATTEDLATTGAGNYSVTVTDLNGCTFTTSLVLTEPAPMMMSANLVNIPCNGFFTGAIDVTPSGGVLPYAYNWSNNAQTQDVDSLGAGTYSTTITDANGCTASNSYTITQLAPVVLTATSSNPLCFGDANGNVDLAVNGGTSPYNYSWSNGETTEDLGNAGGGTYIVIVTDAFNCSASDTFLLVNPALLTANVTSPLLASNHNVTYYGGTDGSVDADVTGGTLPYSYQWSNGSTSEDLAGLGAGTYSVIITDAHGCSVSDSITLDQPFDLAMPTGFSPNSDGKNDFFVVHGLEAYPDNKVEIFNRWGNQVYDSKNYNNRWNGSNENGEALPDGTYFVVLTINNGDIVLKGYVDIRR